MKLHFSSEDQALEFSEFSLGGWMCGPQDYEISPSAVVC